MFKRSVADHCATLEEREKILGPILRSRSSSPQEATVPQVTLAINRV
jgi:hypothetical protein